MNNLVPKIRKLHISLSIFFCVVLHLWGYNLRSKSDPPDMPSVLFLCYIVLHLHKIRREILDPMNRLWILPFYLLVMYLLTQAAMFLIWYPFWRVISTIVNWILETESGIKIFDKAPKLYMFLRNDIPYIIEFFSVIILTFKPLKGYFCPTELNYEQLSDLTLNYDFPEAANRRTPTRGRRRARQQD